MRIKEIAIRLCYTLLGSLLTLCIVLIHDEYVEANSSNRRIGFIRGRNGRSGRDSY